VPTLGVLPWIDGVALDAEDSLAFDGALPRPAMAAPTTVDVAVVRFPHVANATDVDPLAIEPGVAVRWVDHARALGDPDLVVLPGSKSTVSDLAWLRAQRLDAAIARTAATVIGICGGYQLLGRTIADPSGVESPPGTIVEGLGWLEVDTVLAPEKVTRQRRGTTGGHDLHGYEIHHGRTVRRDGAEPWLDLDRGEREGTAVCGARTVLGTSLHGLFEADRFRHSLLATVAHRRGRKHPPSGTSFAAAREAQLDRLGDLVERNLDMAAIDRLIEELP
jgi:adenosylcobyric acid synthase